MPIPSTPAQTSRRGNALVLAASVLVLLVIIATTFVSRTQTGRATAAAVRKEAERQDSVDGVGEDIAQLVANALFVRPVDARYDSTGVQGLVNALPGETIEDDADGLNFSFSLPSTFPLADQIQFEANNPGIPAATNSNRIRLDPARAVRDSALADRFVGFNLDQRYGVDPWFPGNFAPFEVVPFTNWPDGLAYPWSTTTPWGVLALDTQQNGNGIPFTGNGSPSTLNVAYGTPNDPNLTRRLLTEGNPVFGPGFGDTRWLRDLEPMAVDQNNDGLLDSFLQWRHLTNISTPENGWRVVFDISDVFGAKELQAGGPPLPNLIDDLSVPVEQWVDSLDYRVLFIGGNNLPGYSIGNTGAAAMVLGNFDRI
ncbi:MAG: hypothetical protein EVA77_06645, partial [Phycisphaeraceae bacterium]